jgi:hypothetical protein
VVADDEDNVLRVYDAERGGDPLNAVDLSPQLPVLQDQGKPARTARSDGKPRKMPETDLEAATRLGKEAYWLTSHGRNSKGKKLQARFIFFATTIRQSGAPVSLVGQPYVSLLEDLLASEALRGFDLQAASQRAPKEPAGLNVEGLTAMPSGGGMYLGFRNPVPGGRALLVPLLNARQIVNGGRARLGPPVQLDLGGLGIRGLSWHRGRYLVLAGHFAEGVSSRLYTWDGRGAAQLVSSVDLTGFNPEGFFTPEERQEILLLSDDGGQELDGVPCKELKDPRKKRFRGRWLGLPARR